VIVPKDKGGLGIKDLYVQNDALLLNHVRDSKGFGEELGRIGEHEGNGGGSGRSPEGRLY